MKAQFLKTATNPRQYPDHPWPEIALAGRSNVGKSSLINGLIKGRAMARVGKRPGVTQTINFYAVDDQFVLVDLPGYGYAQAPKKVRESWGPMIETYLLNREALKAVVLLIDSRHGPTDSDMLLWEWLPSIEADRIVVATKWDKVKKSQRAKRQAEMERELGVEVIPYSSVDGTGKGQLIGTFKAIAVSR